MLGNIWLKAVVRWRIDVQPKRPTESQRLRTSCERGTEAPETIFHSAFASSDGDCLHERERGSWAKACRKRAKLQLLL